MQRLLGLILAIVVAVASLTPCCTEEEGGVDRAASAHHDPPKGDDGCLCSPFFACATCPGFVPTTKPIALPAPLAYPLRYAETPVSYFSFPYAATPWQPPRLA